MSRPRTYSVTPALSLGHFTKLCMQQLGRPYNLDPRLNGSLGEMKLMVFVKKELTQHLTGVVCCPRWCACMRDRSECHRIRLRCRGGAQDTDYWPPGRPL
eukprot:SAG25_NODE_5874_length_611_cov_0.708984_1_plen_99_part_01